MSPLSHRFGWVVLAVLGMEGPGAWAGPLPCSQLQINGNGRCVNPAVGGMTVWSDQTYGFLGGPSYIFHQSYTYALVPLGSSSTTSPCSGGGSRGGWSGSVTGSNDVTVLMACATHYGPQTAPAGTGTSGWRRIPGDFAMSSHGGTPCGFYEATLQPNVQTSICCPGRWGSSAFFATGPDTTTLTTTTTDNGIYRDVNASFHLAFNRLGQVLTATQNNAQAAAQLSQLISLVTFSAETQRNATSLAVSALSSQMAVVSTATAAVSTQQASIGATVSSIQAAVSAAAAALPPVGPGSYSCSGNNCDPKVARTGNQVTISARQGTVGVETASCGTVDLCNIANAVNALRGL